MSTEKAALQLLNSTQVDDLAIAVEEAERAASVDNPFFVEPARGTLARAKSSRHHIVFGRRGSGKTSLLAKAAADGESKGAPVAFVDLEPFKGHSYPDVLLSVIIAALRKYSEWFESPRAPQPRKGWLAGLWAWLSGRSGGAPNETFQQVAIEIRAEIQLLERELHTADSSDLRRTTEQSHEASQAAEAGVRADVPGASADARASAESRAANREEVIEESRRSKIDFLHRHIIDYRHLFEKIVKAANADAYLVLDDLYHIRKADQAQVLDYLHRAVKGNRIWLKIGTIRHRSQWYKHSDPPIGLKLGDDVQEIDLDVTLEQYKLARSFLMNVLRGIAGKAGFDRVDDLLADTAVDRLVLGSGGVARDFLGLFRRSIYAARERAGGARGPRIAATDVNQVAGQLDALKRDELNRDVLEEREQIERAFDNVRSFCLDEANSNCFLIEKDSADFEATLIEELADLRLIHLVQSRVTIPDRPGKVFIAYMLDLGQYAGERVRRGLEMIDFWRRRERDRLRRVSLVYKP